MNGLSIPNTPIVVDYWDLKHVHARSLFFLSHMHADHTTGLSEGWPHPIYCSPITAKLLIRKFKVQPHLVIELEIDEAKILTVNCPDERVTVTVTALDANHCPGSTMFLFEGYFGTILYTGDFRFCPSMLENPSLSGKRTIDVLYLDNTYCDPHCKFPSREEATEMIVYQINKHPDSLVFFGLHTLGKEGLLVDLAERLDTWIGVSEDRHETLELLEMPNVFSKEVTECRLRVYPQYMVVKGLISEMTNGQDYIAILPTCVYTGRGAPPCPDGNSRLKIIPYSDHSSFDELWRFVKSVRPKTVCPIVRSFTGDGAIIASIRSNMAIFEELLDTSEKHKYEIPTGIKKLLSLPYSERAFVHSKLRRSLTGSRPGTKPPPKGVQFTSPKKSPSLQEPVSAAEPVLQDLPPSTKANEQVCSVDKGLATGSGLDSGTEESGNEQQPSETMSEGTPSSSDLSPSHDKSFQPEFALSSTQDILAYFQKKVVKKDKTKLDNRDTTTFSCARIVPVSCLQLKRDKPSIESTLPTELEEKSGTCTSMSETIDPALEKPSTSTSVPASLTVDSIYDSTTTKKPKVLETVDDENVQSESLSVPEEHSADNYPGKVKANLQALLSKTLIIPLPRCTFTRKRSKKSSMRDNSQSSTARDAPVVVAAEHGPRNNSKVQKMVAPESNGETAEEISNPFLNFPYEAIKRTALKNNDMPFTSCNVSEEIPEFAHDWGPEHHANEETYICDCEKGEHCLLLSVCRLKKV